MIEHRIVILQRFADRICRHPVLSNSEVWKHFLIQVDEKEWTQGKRKAEADPNVGHFFLTDVNVHSINEETKKIVVENIRKFSNGITKFHNAVKNMKSVANEQISKHKQKHANDYEEIGKAFSLLGSAMSELAPCFIQIGASYQEMSRMWDRQVSKDWEPMLLIMQEYKGLAEGWQSIMGEYEKEKDSPHVQNDKYRIAIEAEATNFKHELSMDMANTAQVWKVFTGENFTVK